MADTIRDSSAGSQSSVAALTLRVVEIERLDVWVPAAFKRHVRRELDEARRRCFELLGLPYQRRTRSDRGRRHRYTKGVCAGCGCTWDRMTPGCVHCVGRDYYRETSGKPRLRVV